MQKPTCLQALSFIDLTLLAMRNIFLDIMVHFRPVKVSTYVHIGLTYPWMTRTRTIMTLIKYLVSCVNVLRYTYSTFVEQVPIIDGKVFP